MAVFPISIYLKTLQSLPTGFSAEEWMNVDFPDCWIGRNGPDDKALCRWPS